MNIRCAIGLALLACMLGGCKTIRADARVTMSSPPNPDGGPLYAMTVRPGDESPYKIAVVDVDGLLLNQDLTGLFSVGENPVALFREKLDAVAANRCYRAVVLRINSHGGGVTASDIMWRDLQNFKSRTGLPVVACLMDVGTGGSYYLATAADEIMAHPTTITGGLGVILNLYNLQDLLAQFNIIPVPIKAGDNVDVGSPLRPGTDTSRELLQQMADEFHARFRDVVQQGRPQHKLATDDFDGRVFTAYQALQRGLIDRVGYLDDAIQLAADMAGIPGSRAVVLHRLADRARTPYEATPNLPMQAGILPMSIPGIERSKLPTFLYIWQPEPTMERLGGR